MAALPSCNGEAGPDAHGEVGYWTSAKIISLGMEGSSTDLLGRLLNGVYDAVPASVPTASCPAVEATQLLVRSFRLRGGGISASASGFDADGN